MNPNAIRVILVKMAGDVGNMDWKVTSVIVLVDGVATIAKVSGIIEYQVDQIQDLLSVQKF